MTSKVANLLHAIDLLKSAHKAGKTPHCYISHYVNSKTHSPARPGSESAPTCSCPRTNTPSGLMGWYGARFSPLPRVTPSWKASHIPSRVVHVMHR